MVGDIVPEVETTTEHAHLLDALFHIPQDACFRQAHARNHLRGSWSWWVGSQHYRFGVIKLEGRRRWLMSAVTIFGLSICDENVADQQGVSESRSEADVVVGLCLSHTIPSKFNLETNLFRYHDVNNKTSV